MQPVIRYPDPEGWLRSLEFDQQERAASDDFGGQQPASSAASSATERSSSSSGARGFEGHAFGRSDGVGVGEHAATFANPAAALAAQDPAGLSVEVKWEEWREEPGFEWPAGEQPAPGAHEDAPMPGEEVNRGT